MKSVSETKRLPPIRPEKTARGFVDKRIADLFEKHAYLIEDDQIFQKIFRTINEGWDNLKSEQRQEILDLIEDLVRVLKDYNSTYTTHKETAKRKRVEEYHTIQDYQAEVKRADAIENALHNRFIDSINILSRKMKAMGLDNSWRGDEKIYGLTAEAMRQKAKNWMFKIFGERI